MRTYIKIPLDCEFVTNVFELNMQKHLNFLYVLTKIIIKSLTIEKIIFRFFFRKNLVNIFFDSLGIKYDIYKKIFA